MNGASLAFPYEGYVGIAGEFADAYSREYESPKEFFYLDLLVSLSVVVSGRVRVDFGSLQTQPRLYGLKIGKSGWARKSTSTRIVEKFLKSVLEKAHFPQEDSIILHGAGSAEGLANAFKAHKRILLSFDEFRRFERKAGIEGSALLSMLNELFDKNEYANYTKHVSLALSDAHLAFLANTTDKNFENMVDSSELMDTGFLNRVLILSSDEQKRIPMPKEPPSAILDGLKSRLAEMLRNLASGQEQVLTLDSDAQQLWIDWYTNLENSEAATRLDCLGMRLMALFALVSCKTSVTVNTVRAVLAVLNHQLRLRKAFTPIDGSNPNARMEQKIVSHLRKRSGGVTNAELRRAVNYSRAGVSVFPMALANLVKNGEVKHLPNHSGKSPSQDTYCLGDSEDEGELHQLASGAGSWVSAQQECR